MCKQFYSSGTVRHSGEEDGVVSQRYKVEHHEHHEEQQHGTPAKDQIIDEHHGQSQQHTETGYGRKERWQTLRRASGYATPHQTDDSTHDQREDRSDDGRREQTVNKPYPHHQEGDEEQSNGQIQFLTEITDAQLIDVHDAYLSISTQRLTTFFCTSTNPPRMFRLTFPSWLTYSTTPF